MTKRAFRVLGALALSLPVAASALVAVPAEASSGYFGSVAATRPSTPPFVTSPGSFNIGGGPVTVTFSFQVHNRSKTPAVVPVDFSVHHILTYFGRNVADGEPGKTGISFGRGDSTSTTQAGYGTPVATVVTVAPRGSAWQTLTFSQVISSCGYYQFDAGYHSGGSHLNLSTGFTRVLGCQSAGGSVAPTISATVTDRQGNPIAPNSAGWYRQALVVHFNCSDPVFPVTSCGPDRNLGEGAGQVVHGTAMDSAGNTAGATAGPLNVDLTPPSIVPSTDGSPNGNGWFNRSVTVSFTCSDNLSGVSACPSPLTISNSGSASVTRSITDNAGNSATASITVDVDRAGPQITVTGVTDGGAYAGSATPVIHVSDNYSGLAVTSASLDGSPFGSGSVVHGMGSHLLSISASDLAGNSASTAVQFFVKHATAVSWSGDTQGQFGHQATLAAVLTDTTLGGQPVAGATVNLSGGNQACSAVTDANGRASCPVSLSSPAGTYSNAASFQETGDYFAATELGSFQLQHASTDLVLVAPGISQSTDITVSGQLTDGAGHPLPNQPLVLALGGPSSIVTTDNQGVATLNLSLAPGTYTASGQFIEDPDYSGASATTTIQIIVGHGDGGGPLAGLGSGSTLFGPLDLGAAAGTAGAVGDNLGNGGLTGNRGIPVPGGGTLPLVPFLLAGFATLVAAGGGIGFWFLRRGGLTG